MRHCGDHVLLLFIIGNAAGAEKTRAWTFPYLCRRSSTNWATSLCFVLHATQGDQAVARRGEGENCEKLGKSVLIVSHRSATFSTGYLLAGKPERVWRFQLGSYQTGI
mmetsp:Transcript_39358/g.59466  ORF Transcript_39358/g.59466 Transcript_39358/m.59466 type:complete len:108 (-) Transcript_39358:237-560(-)